MKSPWAFLARLRPVSRLRRDPARFQAVRSLIEQSKLFDPAWYVGRYPDVASAGSDPLIHFIRHGAAEGRSPSERFDLPWYLRRNLDVARSGINPLVHYLEYGRAEGRSIRSLGSGGSQDPDDEPVDPAKHKNKKKKAAEAAQPYPSDFAHGWRARPMQWSALSEHAAPNVVWSRADHGTETSPDTSPDTLDPASFLVPEQAENQDVARIAWFMATRRDADVSRESGVATGDASPAMASERVGQILRSHGLGLERIVDGWFCSFDRLILRVAGRDERATRLRAFQFDSAGAISRCADMAVGSGYECFLAAELEHELCPLLLVWTDSADALVGAVVLPFPSLCRGGLHHAELMAWPEARHSANPLAAYAMALACELFPENELDEPLAFGRFTVDLAGSIGTEPLFSPGTIAALASQFGVGLDVQCGEAAAAGALASRLQQVSRGPRLTDRMSGGGVLIIPADGIPSLAAMVARRSGKPLGSGSFCIANAANRQPEVLVCMPSVSAAIAGMRHPGLPLARPVCAPDSKERWPAFGSPVMVRFRDEKVWAVDAIMPVSPDVPMPMPVPAPAPAPAPDSPSTPIEGTISRVSVIVHHGGDPASLSSLQVSLQAQTASVHEVLLAEDASNCDAADAPLVFPGADNMPQAGATLGQRLNAAAARASADYLLFVHASVILPDPRTLDLLLALASQPQVACVACDLVREDSADGHLTVFGGGTIVQLSQASLQPAWEASSLDVSRLAPLAAYPVLASDLSLCVIPRRVWMDMQGFANDASALSPLSFDFATRARARGLVSLGTNLVRAAMAAAEPVDEPDNWPAQGPFLSIAEQTVAFRSLGR